MYTDRYHTFSKNTWHISHFTKIPRQVIRIFKNVPFSSLMPFAFRRIDVAASRLQTIFTFCYMHAYRVRFSFAAQLPFTDGGTDRNYNTTSAARLLITLGISRLSSILLVLTRFRSVAIKPFQACISLP